MSQTESAEAPRGGAVPKVAVVPRVAEAEAEAEEVEPDSVAEEKSALATSPVAQAGLGVVAAGFGVVALLDASDLDMFGDKGIPGPGFAPVSLAIAVIALGLLLVVVSVIRGIRHGLGPAGQMAGVGRQLLRAGSVWIGFLVSIPLMPLIGFVPVTVLLIAYLVLVVERIRNLNAIVVIVAVPVVAYALFVFVLGVELPTSVLFEGI
jgi:Tripartite tricarboxylate transporter TctB family